MAKGKELHQARLDQISRLGKPLGRRAGFRCEWCEGGDDLRPHDLAPKDEPALETLLLLCAPCRELAAGRGDHARRLRDLGNALWSEHPCVSHSVARVLAASGLAWAKEAVEDAYLPDELKRELLG